MHAAMLLGGFSALVFTRQASLSKMALAYAYTISENSLRWI